MVKLFTYIREVSASNFNWNTEYLKIFDLFLRPSTQMLREQLDTTLRLILTHPFKFIIHYVVFPLLTSLFIYILLLPERHTVQNPVFFFSKRQRSIGNRRVLDRNVISVLFRFSFRRSKVQSYALFYQVIPSLWTTELCNGQMENFVPQI